MEKNPANPGTPAIAVSEASRTEERMVVGTLGTLAAEIRAADLPAPATLIVGEVARSALDLADGSAGHENDHNDSAPVSGEKTTVGAI